MSYYNKPYYKIPDLLAPVPCLIKDFYNYRNL